MITLGGDAELELVGTSRFLYSLGVWAGFWAV